MTNQVKAYLQSKQLAWAPSTLQSEAARLASVEDVLDGNPERLWKCLEEKQLKPYARVTTWIRVMNYWDYLIEQGATKGNPYRQFKRVNARLFKHAYTPKKPEMTYEEAKQRIESIQDASIRRRALEILGSGLRWTESSTHNGSDVVGKGSRKRQVYVPQVDGPEFAGTYQTFRRALARVGLKPHDLRKLFLTKMRDEGADQFELMEVAGWRSLEPAKSYITVNKQKLNDRIKKIQGGK